MHTVVVAHRDPHKAGATEHVDAIVQSLRSDSSRCPIDAIVTVENQYNTDKAEPVDLTQQLAKIRYEHGDVRYVVITGDYGCDPSNPDKSVAETLKRILSHDNPWGVQIILSSYTADNTSINEAFKAGIIDWLAVPEYAIDCAVLEGTSAAEIMKRARHRLILMTAVPHGLTQRSLEQKYTDWQSASRQNKVTPLPRPVLDRPLVTILIPGDVEDASGQPKLFTPANAIALADAIAKDSQHRPSPIYLVSNGPRTSKYRAELLDIPNANFNNPAFQNAARMDGIGSNPVTKVFVERLQSHAGAGNIILGCIAKGQVPPQGFLAFYQAMNQQVAGGGKASLYVDGVSTTMIAQAVNVLDSHIAVIACDTPAKNRTHDVGINALFAKGHVDCLRLSNAGYYYLDRNSIRRSHAVAFDDGAVVQNTIKQLLRLPSSERFNEFFGSRPASANITITGTGLKTHSGPATMGEMPTRNVHP